MTALLLAGCNTQPQASAPIKIGYAALRSSVPVYLAQEKGIFKKYGLTVELQRFETAQPIMESLVAGNLDAGGYTAMPIIESAMIRSKTPLYFTTAMLEDQAHRISYLIVPKDAPAGMKITDLKGKKVGILPTVAYKVYIEQILKANGMQPTDVEIVQVKPRIAADSFTVEAGGLTVHERSRSDRSHAERNRAQVGRRSGVAKGFRFTVPVRHLQHPQGFRRQEPRY